MKFTGLSMSLLPHPEAADLIEQWNGLLSTQIQCQLGGNILQGCGKVLPKAVHALNQHPIYGAIFLIARIHRFRNQGVEMGVAPFTITPSDPLAKYLLPVPQILCSASLEDLVPEGNASTRRHNNKSVEQKVKAAALPLWVPRASGSTGKEEGYGVG